MDDLEQRLRQDADRIRPEASPALKARIDASLATAREAARQPVPERPAAPRWWLFSSLTGIAATLFVVVVLNWPRAGDPPPVEVIADTPPVESAGTATGVWLDDGPLPLDVRPADLTRSLEDELDDLKADIEKARQGVEEDIGFTF